MPLSNRDPAREILDRYKDGEFSIFACGEDAPSESVIVEFEEEIGYRLPEDFRAFSMSSLGGIYIEVRESIWPRAKAYDVGPFWSFLYGLFAFGFGKDIPDWMDIRIQARSFRRETGHDVVPVLKVLCDADLYCVDSSGRLSQWQHETGEMIQEDGSFLDLLEKEIRSLKERKERKKREQSSTGDGAARVAPEE